MKAIRKPHWITWKEVGKRTLHKAGEDDITGRAAELAYYFFLSIFPMVLFVLAIVGIFASHTQGFRTEILQFLGRVAPSSPLIRNIVDQVTKSNGGGKLSIGVILTLWSASSGMSAIMDTINAEYKVKETRSFVKQEAIALALTIACGVLLIVAAGIALVGADEIKVFAVGGVIPALWEVVRWPISVAIVLFGFALIYHFAPNVERHEWHWVTPGSLFAMALWILASIGFRIYLHYFNRFSATYGSLGAVIILLLWFYITGLSILLGSELDIVIQSAITENPAAGTARRRQPSAA